jgi:hypothetical protein
MRHESGHFYWLLLVNAAGWHGAFRQLFGDERTNYADALARHHTAGPPADWQQAYVSAYATSHPWEDWAESWAHYLHIVDTVDTAQAVGIVFGPDAAAGSARFDAYNAKSIEDLMARWVPLTLAVNSLSRSMGHDDFYPFVLPPPTLDKLRFIHQAVQRARARAN